MFTIKIDGGHLSYLKHPGKFFYLDSERMSYSILRTSSRVTGTTPLRVTPYFVRKPLGSYPIPNEAKIWWKNRYQV